MSDLSGKPVARLDVRVEAGQLALEVTVIHNSVMVQAFGAPEGVSVTEILLKQQPDRLTS
ncbi:hypothetical protein ACWIID_05335 [Streptomyces phaeochromogenes]